MLVYEVLRRYLKENCINEAIVAQKAGITQESFREILAGHQTLYADDLRAICLALNVSPEFFIETNHL